MYPFCLTLPFGGFVALGGLIGFIQSGSTPSLLAGGGSGAILIERTFLFPPVSETPASCNLFLHQISGSLLVSSITCMPEPRSKSAWCALLEELPSQPDAETLHGNLFG